MKKIAIILFVGSILASCMSSKEQFNITGKVQGIDTGMIFLQKYDLERWVTVDSVKLEKGDFAFTGKTDIPGLWHLAMNENQVMVPLFLENARIEVLIFPDSLEKSTIRGSATHDLYRQYLTLNESISTRMDDVYKEWKKAKEAGDTLGMQRFDSISNALDAEMKIQLRDFVKTNNMTVVSPYLVLRNSWQFELPELEEIVNGLDSNLNRSPYMQALQKRVVTLKSVSVGQIAPDFEMNDSTGQAIKLSSFKGKVLLVDFWASWCGPCRAENPNVVRAYQAYSAKGFDVLGCSFDQKREKWIKAIKDDKLTWTHVSDLKGWGNEAGKLYGVNSIPANVLLDKDQRIIAHNLRGDDLLNKLLEILGPAAPVKTKHKMR